jgi:hypothetical protein
MENIAKFSAHVFSVTKSGESTFFQPAIREPLKKTKTGLGSTNLSLPTEENELMLSEDLFLQGCAVQV